MEREDFLNCVEEKDERLEALKQLYPEIFSDGKINLDAFKDVTGTSELPDGEDKNPGYYGLYWPGKRAAKQLAKKPATGTLEPVQGDGVNEDTTHNIYIEGDNLEVLRTLRNSYRGRVKMIYIDPPYNTGNDFIYPDDFADPVQDYLKLTGQIDDKGKKLVVNTKTSGSFHRNWLNMMYSRLSIAKELIKDDGIIFISIDDNEQGNLRLLCDDIFGEENFISELIWQNKKGGGNDSKYIAIEHEYIMVYAKNKNLLNDFYEQYSSEYIKRYKEEDEIGRFYWDTFKRKSGKQYYPITCPDGTVLQYDEDGNPISWLRSKARFESDLKIGEIRIVDNKGKWSVQFKQRMPLGKTPRSIFTTNTVVDDKGTTSTGADDTYQYFKKDVFSNPKPVELISFMLGFGLQPNEIAIDFFSGSGTLAEAVIKMNTADNGNRHFILVQMQEGIDKMLESSNENAKRVAENAVSILDSIGKPHYITELAKERIRRAGTQIKKDTLNDSIDIGFKVYRLSESNFTKYKPVKGQNKEALNELYTSLGAMVDPLIDGWKPENVLEEIKLRQGFALDCQVEEVKEITSNKVWHLTDPERPITLYVCLDEKIEQETVDTLNIGKDDKFICLNSAINDTTYARLADKNRVQTL